MPEENESALAATLSEKLRSLSAELRKVESELKSATMPEAMALQEFRHVLDNTRLTAWTVAELLNALETRKDPNTILSFLVAERLRRFGQMTRDLCADLNKEDFSTHAGDVQRVSESLARLQVRLSQLNHCSRATELKER